LVSFFLSEVNSYGDSGDDLESTTNLGFVFLNMIRSPSSHLQKYICECRWILPDVAKSHWYMLILFIFKN